MLAVNSWRDAKPLIALLAVCFLVTSCDDDSRTPPEQEIPDWDGGVTFTPPRPPNLPNWSDSCPDDWEAVVPEDGGGVGWCEPYPMGEYPECERYEAFFPGGDNCQLIGDPCTDDEWLEGVEGLAAEVGSPAVLYVRAGGGAGGRGTRASPYGSAAEAVADAEPGSIIALGKGTFNEPIGLDKPLIVLGACVAETVIRSPDPTKAALSSVIDEAVVGNFRITGPGPGIVVLGFLNTLSVVETIVEDTAGFGLGAAEDGILSGKNIVVRGMSADPSWTFSSGLRVESRGDIVLEGAVIEDIEGIGSDNSQIGVIVLVDTAVRNTRPAAGLDDTGIGIVVGRDGTVILERSILEGNHCAGVYGFAEHSDIQMEDVVVRDTFAIDGDSVVCGGLVSPYRSSDVSLVRTVFEHNDNAGIDIRGISTSAEIRDIVVREGRPWSSEDSLGGGIRIEGGTLATIERAFVEKNTTFGIAAGGGSTHVSMTDVVVRDTLGSPAFNHDGAGLLVLRGAKVRLERGVIERSTGMGMLLTEFSGLGPSELSDVVIQDTARRACAEDSCANSTGGGGLLVHGGAELRLDSFQLLGNGLCGLHIGYGTHDEHDYGLLELTAGEVAHNRVCGANVFGDGYDLETLTDDVIYHDNNGRNLDTTEMSVPETTNPFEW